MKTLIIYDDEGYVVQLISGSYRVPVGIPFLEVEIPDGKRIQEGIGIDLSVTPHEVILIDTPKSQTELLEERLSATEEMLLQFMMEGMM